MGKPQNMVLVTLGSTGDVYPFIAIGKELKQRGHRVVLVTNEHFQELIHLEGLESHSIGSKADYARIIETPDLWDPQKGFRVFAEQAVLPFVMPVYEYLQTHDPQNTLLVAQGQTFGAHLAHEKSEFPFVTIQLQPGAFRSVHEFPLLPAWLPKFAKGLAFSALDRFVIDPVFAPELNSYRKEIELKPIGQIFKNYIHSPQKTIALFDDWFAEKQPDWPQNTVQTGFTLYDPSKETEIAKQFQDFFKAGEAPIIFTPGTAMKHGERFFTASLEAAQSLGKRAILLTKFREQLPESLPEGIVHFDYIPFRLVLPKAAALVHHGGIGTTAQAIASGVPQLIRPMAHDQPDNAARVEKLGVGLKIPDNKYGTDKVVKKLDELLSSTQIQENCKTMAQKVDSNMAIKNTCDHIEAVA